MGPRRAAAEFLRRTTDAASYRVTLYGSLAATGRGHLTDRAIEETISPTANVSILWQPHITLPLHPNGMLFEALDTMGNVIKEWRVYSV